MPGADMTLHLYEEIAEQHQQMGDAEQRDIFLVLAADAAFNAGFPDLAEQMRLRLLTVNPYHLLRPYMSFTEALQSADIQTYIDDLVRRYPPENARQLLNDLKDRQAAAAARDLLFAQAVPDPEISDLRVFQQFDDATPVVAPVPRVASHAEPPRRAQPVPQPLPISLAPAAPWLRQDQSGYDNGEPTALDPVDQPDYLGNWIAFGLFVLASFVAAALFGWTFIFPLIRQ